MLLLVTVSVPSWSVLKPQLIPKSQKSYKITNQQNECESPSTKNWFAQGSFSHSSYLPLSSSASCQLPGPASFWSPLVGTTRTTGCWWNSAFVFTFFFDPSIFCRKLFARHNIPRDDVTKFKLTVPAQPIKASKVFQCSMFAGLWSVWKVQLVDWPESTLTGRTWQKWRLYRPTKVLPSIWGQLQWWPGTFNLFLCHMSIPQTNHVLRQNRWARAS